MFRNILLGILIVLAYTSCKNISPQSSCYKDTSHLDSPSIYKPDSTNNRWGGEEVLLFYQYQDEPGSNIHLTWDIYAHTIYFVSPNPIHFLHIVINAL